MSDVIDKPAPPVYQTVLSASGNRFQPAEFSQQVWTVRPQFGLPFEALLIPSCWRHYVHYKIEPGAKLCILPDDMAYYAEVIVWSKNSNGIVVLPYGKADAPLAPTETLISDELTVKWGGAHKWRVLRRSDNAVMAKDFQTEEDAWAWIAANRKRQL